MKSMYVIMYNGHPCAVTKNEKDAKKCVEEKNAARKGEEQFGPEFTYRKVDVWIPDARLYTLSYTSRYGYSIEFGEKIENALIEISKNDEMLYDEIQDHIRQMFKDSIDEYGTNGIQFERWAYGECDEYFDSDSDSESRFPDELVKDADKLMDMLREYIREYKEVSRLVITDIDWDTDGEKAFGLPKNIKVFISRLLREDETEESVDEDELKDRAIDYLSDEYGYCISGVGDIEREVR